MNVRLSRIKEEAVNRPEGYEQDVISKGVIVGEFVNIPPSAYAALKAKYSPHAPASGGCCGGGKKSSFPTIPIQIGNAARAAGRAMGAALTGRPIKADPQVVLERQAICNKCEFFKNDRCTQCGCYVRLKLTMATEKCPKNFW